jgi:hypothetical protein
VIFASLISIAQSRLNPKTVKKHLIISKRDHTVRGEPMQDAEKTEFMLRPFDLAQASSARTEIFNHFKRLTVRSFVRLRTGSEVLEG